MCAKARLSAPAPHLDSDPPVPSGLQGASGTGLWNGQGGVGRQGCPELPHCLHCDWASHQPPTPLPSDKVQGPAEAGGTGPAKAVRLRGPPCLGDRRESCGHQSPLPHLAGVLEVGWGGGKLGAPGGSRARGSAPPPAGPGCRSLGFLLGEPVSGTGRGGCEFLVRI